MNKQAGVWVKASERLPDVGKQLHIKLDSVVKKVGHWSLSDNAFMVWEDGSLVRYPPTLYFIEWLDEQPIPVNQDDYWKKRCEAAEKVMTCYGDWRNAQDDEDELKTKEYQEWDKALKEWQQLKSSQSPTPVHDPEICGCGSHSDYCPYNPDASEVPENEKKLPKTSTIKTLINELFELMPAHINPYNLGEMGRINAIIHKLKKLSNHDSTPVQEGLREDEKENQGN